MWASDSTSPEKSGEAVLERQDGAPPSRYAMGTSELPTADDATLEIHIPEGLRDLEDHEILVIAIGENAPIAAVCAGIPCIGLQNAWAWSVSLPGDHVHDVSDLEAAVPIPALMEFARPYRRVLVLGGSDLVDDGADRPGLELLAAALRNHDIRAQVAYVPCGVILDRGQPRILPQGVYEWLSSTDRVAAKPNLSALFFAAEVLQCSGITDSFNAHMIADLFRNELAYSRGCWYVWDGRIWSRDSDQIRRRLAARVAEMYRAYAQRLQNLVAIATGAFTKKDLPYPLAAWLRPIAPVISAATKSAATVQNLRTMDAAFTIAQAHLHVASDAWDREHHLLAVYNGVVDLRTGALQAPSPHFRMTRIAGCAYNPAAVAPRFGRFLSEVQPDSEVRAYLQRLIGYAATGEAREQKFFSFVGDGGNGKGTFVSSIMDALGDYAVKANAGLLAEQAPDKPRNDLAALAGARLLSISELPANLRADAALLKSITGGDVISARFLNREFFQFRPCFTSILDTNHPLIIRENTTAAVRRRVTIPWSVTIPDEKSDSSLHERLSQELPGILAWIVEGARQYYSTGLGSLKQPVHKEPIDSFAEWLETCVRNDPAARVQSSVLYQSYCEWGNNPGAEVRLDIKAFGTALAARGFQEPKKSNGVMMWRGICLGPRQTQCS